VSITQNARSFLSTFYQDQPTIARAIHEGLLDKKHERALKAITFLMDNDRRTA
jgi:hypothetical protein